MEKITFAGLEINKISIKALLFNKTIIFGYLLLALAVFGIYEVFVERMFEKDWITDYVTALVKMTLGEVRRKMENASNMVGNIGATFNGSALMSEGLAEKEKLEEKLQDTEVYEGYGLSWG